MDRYSKVVLTLILIMQIGFSVGWYLGTRDLFKIVSLVHTEVLDMNLHGLKTR